MRITIDRSSVQPRFLALINTTVNAWSVLDYAETRTYGDGYIDERVHVRFYFICRCVCGKYRKVCGTYLVNKTTKSCGCRHKIKHGCSSGKRTKTYKTWMSMLERCFSSSCPAYPNYGGRGITVCERWKVSFIDFLSDMGERPKGMSIDRIDNDGNYEPGNCRWATMTQQSNNRRTNRRIIVDGTMMTLAEAARHRGWPYGVIPGRLALGWSDEDATSVPYMAGCKFSRCDNRHDTITGFKS